MPSTQQLRVVIILKLFSRPNEADGLYAFQQNRAPHVHVFSGPACGASFRRAHESHGMRVTSRFGNTHATTASSNLDLDYPRCPRVTGGSGVCFRFGVPRNRYVSLGTLGPYKFFGVSRGRAGEPSDPCLA